MSFRRKETKTHRRKSSSQRSNLYASSSAHPFYIHLSGRYIRNVGGWGNSDFKYSCLDEDRITLSRPCAACFHILCSRYLQEGHQQHKGKTAKVIFFISVMLSATRIQLRSFPTVGNSDPFTSYIGALRVQKHAKEMVEEGYYKVTGRWNILTSLLTNVLMTPSIHSPCPR